MIVDCINHQGTSATVSEFKLLNGVEIHIEEDGPGLASIRVVNAYGNPKKLEVLHIHTSIGREMVTEVNCN